VVAAPCVNNDDDVAKRVQTNRYPTLLLTERDIRHRERALVFKDGYGIGELDAMLASIQFRFARIPLDQHVYNCTPNVRLLTRAAQFGSSKTHSSAPPPGGFWISGTSGGQVMACAPPLPTTTATYCLPFTL